MQWAISKSHESIGERGEKLRIKDVKGIGDQATIGGGVTKIGAGGLGMGVKLAVSDTEDQSRNKKNLMKFFKLEARKRKKEQELSNEKNFRGNECCSRTVDNVEYHNNHFTDQSTTATR